ncbi:hypothetical protein ACRRTK_008511 [Alexandromys fortis]
MLSVALPLFHGRLGLLLPFREPIHTVGLSWTLLVFFLHFTQLWSFSVLYSVWLYLDWNTPIQKPCILEFTAVVDLFLTVQ